MDKEKTINSQIPLDELIEGMVFGDDVIDKEGRFVSSSWWKWSLCSTILFEFKALNAAVKELFPKPFGACKTTKSTGKLSFVKLKIVLSL